MLAVESRNRVPSGFLILRLLECRNSYLGIIKTANEKLSCLCITLPSTEEILVLKKLDNI